MRRPKTPPRRSAAGYTMLEMVLVVAILGVVASMGAMMFSQTTNFFIQNTARTQVQRELRVTLNNMDMMIRTAQAHTVNIGNAPGQPPYSSVTFVTVNGSTVTYQQNGRNLVQTLKWKKGVTTVTNNATLTQNLQYIAFTYPQTDINGIMSISVTLQKSTYLGRVSALQMAVSKVRVMNP